MFNVDKIELYDPPLLEEIEETPRHLDAVVSYYVNPLKDDKICKHQNQEGKVFYFGHIPYWKEGSIPTSG